MSSEDLLSFALEDAGIDRQQANQPQASTSNGNQPKIQNTDIKPLMINGEIYYQTPRGVVQFKPDNKIVMVSDFELMVARQSEEARKLFRIQNMGGLQHLGQLMNNGMPMAQWKQSQNNPLNNPAQQGQLVYLNTLSNSNNRASNNFLIDNHYKVFGQPSDLNAELEHRANLLLQAQSGFNSSMLDPDANLAQATRSGRNNFESIFKEVAGDKEIEEDDEQFQAETYAE